MIIIESVWAEAHYLETDLELVATLEITIKFFLNICIVERAGLVLVGEAR